MDVVGEFKTGFDRPEPVTLKMIELVLLDSFVIAITGYFTTLAVEQRVSESLEQDPVNVALISGLANCVSGVFHGLPAMGSVSLSAYLAGNDVRTRALEIFTRTQAFSKLLTDW